MSMILPTGAVDYVVCVGIAFAGRQPYRAVAGQLAVGDRVCLIREPNNDHDANAVLVTDQTGKPAGYLYAADAAYLSLLFDFAPPLRDNSIVTATDGKKIVIELRLHLPDAATIFTLIAILGLKSDQFAADFNLAQNTFLLPLLELNQIYLADNDQVRLPSAIVDFFAQIRSLKSVGRQDVGPVAGKSGREGELIQLTFSDIGES